MQETISRTKFKDFLVAFSRQILQAKDEFNSMDAECGDGDFGSTMAHAFGEALKRLEATSDDDIGSLLTLTGNTILSSAGGASGPTIATIFLEAGKVGRGKSEVTIQDLALMFEMADRQIRILGQAAIGDKTLVDSLEPAANALKQAANAGNSFQDALERATLAARAGCESTKQMIAKHGRAKYLGEQTLGHTDPGAYLVSLFFSNLASSIR